MTWAKPMTVLSLSALFSACTDQVGKAGTILLLVVLPAALVFVLLWGLRTWRQPRSGSKEDRRNYPDFDDRE